MSIPERHPLGRSCAPAVPLALFMTTVVLVKLALGMSVRKLTVTDALELAAEGRPELAERLFDARRDAVTDSGRIILGPTLWPTRVEPVQIRPWRWLWEVTHPISGTILDSGHTWTKTGGWTMSDRAAKRIHDEWYVASLAVEATEDEAGCE